MKIPFVDLHAQYLTIKQEIDRAIAQVIAQSAYIRGPHVDAFEEAWARTLGVKRCVSCANGTDAIYIALRGLGLKRGDEVITSAHSWISTSETITQAGGRVVFCDTDEETFTLIPSISKERSRLPPSASFPFISMDRRPTWARSWRSQESIICGCIEDCAQAHLARYKGQICWNLWQRCDVFLLSGKKPGRLWGCWMRCDQ